MERLRVDEHSVALEVLDILWSTYLLRHHVTGSEDPVEAMRSLKILELLTNDIVVRLCKLRDPDAKSMGFPEALKALGTKPTRHQEAARLAERLAEYVRLTSNLNELRNARVAHLAKRGTVRVEPLVEMYDAVKLAVEITDGLLGERCVYQIANLDLRAEVLGHDAA
jgi:hypothetical protein